MSGKGKTVTFLGGEEAGDPSTAFIVGRDRFPINKPVEVSATRAGEVEKAAKRSGMKVKIEGASEPENGDSEDES